MNGQHIRHHLFSLEYRTQPDIIIREFLQRYDHISKRASQRKGPRDDRQEITDKQDEYNQEQDVFNFFTVFHKFIELLEPNP